MPKFKKKPVVIEAQQYTGRNGTEIAVWADRIAAECGFDSPVVARVGYLSIFTLEGEMKANVGDWVICGVKDEFYPCKPDIFKETYTEVKE